MKKSTLDREAWLTEAASLIVEELIAPFVVDSPPAPPFRVSVGFPPRTRGGSSRVLAVCITSTASMDAHSEIFVSPIEDNSGRILASLVHELVHQADDCASGHRHHFARVARAVGLEGPLTATVASAELSEYLETIIELLGDIPHAAIDIEKAKPAQKTRMLKVSCGKCGFSFRATRKNLDMIESWDCISCGAPDGMGVST